MSFNQPDQEPSEALDSLYEALTEVTSHLHQHAQERQQLEQEIIALERRLGEQRQAAAKAGERDTYDQLSDQLAQLARAWQVLQHDPDEDPLEEYQPDDSTPPNPAD